MHNPLCGSAGVAGAAFENAVRALREEVGASRAKAHAACVSGESINSLRTLGEAGEEERGSRCSSSRSPRDSEHRASSAHSRAALIRRRALLEAARELGARDHRRRVGAAQTQCCWVVEELRTWLCSLTSKKMPALVLASRRRWSSSRTRSCGGSHRNGATSPAHRAGRA